MKKTTMKKAAIENIFIWMVLFVGFATLFFFVIDYATVLRVKDNMNAISDYGANYVGVNGTGDDLTTQINAMKSNSIVELTAGQANTGSICISNANNQYKVIFITQATNLFKFYDKKLITSRAVFNQSGSDTITCTLDITLN
jgi:Flp pilus assembly protein TadG